MKEDAAKNKAKKTEAIKTKEIRTEGIKTEGIKTEGIKTKGIKTDAIRTEAAESTMAKATEPVKEGRRMDEKEYQAVANRVSIITIIGNVLLSILKLFAGIVAHSSAIISDAVHSASDVFSTIVVMIGIRVASKEADKAHPYGHERMECVAAIVLAMVLFVTGLGIGVDAWKDIVHGDYSGMQVPGLLALAAAIISIVLKEGMYWYTRHYAKKLDSGALLADAWHHRSDAFSSVGALIGILGARLGFPVMDSIASLVIFLFIVKAAFDIFKDAMDKMVDHACDEQTEREIYDCVMKNEQVLGIDLLQTRIFGNKIYVDVEILVEASWPLRDAHHIAEQVHDEIEQSFPKVKHIMVHVNPMETGQKL